MNLMANILIQVIIAFLAGSLLLGLHRVRNIHHSPHFLYSFFRLFGGWVKLVFDAAVINHSVKNPGNIFCRDIMLAHIHHDFSISFFRTAPGVDFFIRYGGNILFSAAGFQTVNFCIFCFNNVIPIFVPEKQTTVLQTVKIKMRFAAAVGEKQLIRGLPIADKT